MSTKCSSLSSYQIDERGQDVIEGGGLRRLERLEEWGKALGMLLIQGRKNIGPEALRVIVFLIQGNPGDQRMRGLQRLDPSREQHRFAEASGSTRPA